MGKDKDKGKSKKKKKKKPMKPPEKGKKPERIRTRNKPGGPHTPGAGGVNK
jgi:hypothetical protein